jgi:hypothetical protein
MMVFDPSTPQRIYAAIEQGALLKTEDGGQSPVSIGLDHAGVDREPLATDQPLGDAALYGRLEHLAQQIAIAETAVPVFREGRVVRHRAVETELAEME